MMGWQSFALLNLVSSGNAFLSLMRPDSIRRLSMVVEPPITENCNSLSNLPPATLPQIAGTNTKRLFLVRHGEVVNPGGNVPVYYGAMDVPLSLLGQDEAIAAAKYLSNLELAAVFCSPLSRALYGAEQVAKLQKDALGPIPLEGFKELERGSWRGKTKEQIGEKHLAAFDACDPNATPSGGESYMDLNQRVMGALDQVMNTLRPGQAGAVVSHLQVTRCIVASALGVPLHQLTKIKVATASITCIDYDSSAVPQQQIVHFQSFKPSVGLAQSTDGAN